MDYEGLQETVARLIAGDKIYVNVDAFQNDFESFESADVVFLPTPFSGLPAMVVELKWNKTSGGAISQIKERGYTSNLKPYAGKLLLVGINYDEKSGVHTCKIEKV